MNILPGHEDLKPKVILGFDEMGYALVQHGDGIKRYKMFVGPGGRLHAEPFVEDENERKLPDQLQKLQPERARAIRTYDQM